MTAIVGADISAPMFNEADFNQAPSSGDIFYLFLDPDGANQIVYVGFSSRIPADKLFPNSEYLFRRVGTLTSNDMRFSTPPSIAYDGLGG